jgi:hypothetical protein
MNFRATSALTCIAFASVAALSGCVQFTPVKDMALDKPAYLAAHFNIESLPASVQGKLPSSGTHPLPFKVLAIAGSMVGHVGATTLQGNFQTTMINAKDTGVVQQVSELSSNGIPSAATYSLSYLNLYTLKQETAVYSQRVAPLPILVHGVDNNQFVFDKPREGATYTSTFTSGTTVQIMNFRDMVRTCHAGHYYPASKVTPGLSGQAIDLDCDESKDGIIQNKSRHTYLTEYGVGVVRSMATASAKFEWSYTEFEKDGEHSPGTAVKPSNDKPA